MSKEKKILAKRIIISTIGTLILGFGIGITVQANIGADAVTVFISALANLYPIFSVGNWSSIVCGIMIVITLFMNRKHIGYTTIAYVILGQFTIDLGIAVVPVQESMVTGIIVLLIGLIIVAVSVPIMSSGEMGFSAYDALVFALSEKFKTSYKVVRYVSDAIFLIIGYLIGGLIGVGTIISLVCLGYMIDKAMKIISPRLKKLVFESKN